jgi:hypothetical protein
MTLNKSIAFDLIGNPNRFVFGLAQLWGSFGVIVFIGLAK